MEDPPVIHQTASSSQTFFSKMSMEPQHRTRETIMSYVVVEVAVTSHFLERESQVVAKQVIVIIRRQAVLLD
jgi:hypothetical protein